jgi:WD40 repeat protein
MLTVALFFTFVIVRGQSNKELQAEVAKWKKEAARWQARAQEAETMALLQKKLAEQNAVLAEQNAALAQKAERAANRARYLAQAKAMAVKSKELFNDPDQQALVAQQAYRFNDEYEGSPYDNDIYNGLYRALDNPKFNDELTRNLKGHERGAARALITRVESKEIYSGGSDGSILRWTQKAGVWQCDSIIGARDKYHVYSLDLSPDGNWLVAGGSATSSRTRSYIELYDLKNIASGPKRIEGFSAVETVIYSKKENGAYVREQAGFSIKYTDFTTVREVIKPKEKINTIAMSPDGKRLAGAGASGALYVWDIANNYTEQIIYKNPSDITAVCFAPDNRNIVFGDEEGLVKVVTEDSNVPARVLTGHTAHIEQIVFNNAVTFLATTSRDHTVRLWNWKKLSDQPIVLRDQEEWVWSATFSPDDEQLMIGVHSAGRSKETIHVWPTRIATMANSLCKYISRNMTKDEWENFVGSDLPYQQTCQR